MGQAIRSVILVVPGPMLSTMQCDAFAWAVTVAPCPLAMESYVG